MTRVRSPNYPALSLPESIKRVGQVHSRERQHLVVRDAVIKGMGYSGVNGASLSALSAAVKYGLLEQKGRGEDYRVSDRAVAILHPHNPQEKAEALSAAAHAPALFGELLEHFKGSLPSDDNLRAYLVRRGFSQSALTGVIQSFRDTMELVSSSGVGYDLLSPQSAEGLEMTPAAPTITRATPPPPEGEPYRVSITEQGLEVIARLNDVESIEKLIRVLQAGKGLIQPVHGAFDTGQEGGENEKAAH